MSEQEHDTIVERSFRTIVETFSIWTAASFVISGLVNAALFWLSFRMNYFVVAQPTDIIMTAFLYVTVVAVILVMLATPLLWRRARAKGAVSKAVAQRKAVDERRRQRITAKAATLDVLIRRAAIIGALFSIMSTVISLFDDTPNPPDPDTGVKSYWDSPLTRSSVSGLHLSQSSDQFAACGQAPVLWMGSASVILNCHGRLRLVQNTENIIFDRLSPDEAQALASREASGATKIAAAAQANVIAKSSVVNTDTPAKRGRRNLRAWWNLMVGGDPVQPQSEPQRNSHR